MFKKESIISNKLFKISEVIKNCLLPLEKDDPNATKALQGYLKSVDNSVNQIVGSRTIKIPSKIIQNLNEKENETGELQQSYLQYILQWIEIVRLVVQKESKPAPNAKHALDIIEFWRSRATLLNSLYQELSKPSVQILKNTLLRSENQNLKEITEKKVTAFDKAMKALISLNSEAKDNVKFLNTLERQFKILQTDDFNLIEKTIPSLLNGLKLVYIISRHFKSDDRIFNLLIIISNELCDKVETHLNIQDIFKQIRNDPEEKKLEEILGLLTQGRTILYSWKSLFEKTKDNLEEEAGDRWDFNQKPIKERPGYSIKVLDKLKEVIEELKKFMVLLGPQLKAVTGNPEKIDELIGDVRNLGSIFVESKYNLFEKQHKTKLGNYIEKYKSQTEQISKKTNKLISTTFNDLRSSEAAFDLLEKFIKIKSLDDIYEHLHKRYPSVLTNYLKELNKNSDIFFKNKGRKSFSKDLTPVAGAITWKRAIFQRVKRPIIKFLRHQDWDAELFKDVKKQYKEFAVELDKFEKEQFDNWNTTVSQRAIYFLKQKMLVKTGNNRYKVNFPTEFRLLIKEAKSLDQLGFTLPKTVLNIAFQEKEYFKCVDQLRLLLEEYDNSVNKLSDVEQQLFQVQIKRLNDSLSPLTISFNLNSLGISDFVRQYTEELKRFNEMRAKVDEKKMMIEDIVKSIEKASLIQERHFKQVYGTKRPEFYSLQKLYQEFEEDINSVVLQLSEKYKKIGETMLPQIEFVVSKSQSRQSREMRFYYYYWERRVYNALVQMIIRGLIQFKTLINRPGKKPKGLFKVSTEIHYKKVTTIPYQSEIRVTLSNLLRLIKETSLNFPRWKDGTCMCYETEGDGIDAEDRQHLTFQKDIYDNPVIRLLTIELSELKKMAFSRLEKYKSVWEDNKGDFQDAFAHFKRIIWNQKSKFKIDKILEKNPTTENFDYFLSYFSTFKEDFKNQQVEINAGFIRVDFTNVQQAYVNQCKDSLARIGGALLKIAEKQTQEICKEILTYNQNIDQEAESLSELKSYLNILGEIRNQTMNIEFRISDVEEKYSILKLHKLEINKEIYEKMVSLNRMWHSLLKRVKLVNRQLHEKKIVFADQTKEEVKKLREKIAQEHQKYFEKGPGATDTNLKDGYRLLEETFRTLKDLNIQKQELVQQEKLFEIDISLFTKLVEMENDAKKLNPLFKYYKLLDDQISQWAAQSWVKIDYNTLDSGRKKLQSKFSKLQDWNENVKKKIAEKLERFIKMLPLIQQLKANPHFKESNWEYLMNEIGVDTSEINLRSLTLKQVFDLKLQDHKDKVNEVVAAAQTESNNEEQVRQIEIFWKNAEFEVIDFKKGGENKGKVVKVPEELFLTLNDHLVNLQNIQGSKFARRLQKQIKHWIGSLNRTQETLELWLQVQTKWMYLESIYIGNDDIVQQLPKEAKNFRAYHKTFSKINNQSSKSKNVFLNCVQIESNLPQLQSLSVNFDKSQVCLSDYLSSKKVQFSRFYFISDEDLLSILGAVGHEAVTPYLMKLFDNCKQLEISSNGLIKGMYSEKGEFLEFNESVKPEGSVEFWMNNLEKEMRKSLKSLTKKTIYSYAKQERPKWIRESLGMTSLSASKVWWTWRVEDVFRRVKEGDKHALKREAKLLSKNLLDLIAMVRQDLESEDKKGLLRKKINTLIIIDVHQRDIVDRFVRDSILDAKEFEWESQLRFYWPQNINALQFRQCTGVLSAGYEYQGLNGRLVITPLTDRCVMTLTTALTFYLGGAPAGPAGTGKTETCKDLAKSMYRRCVVTNCGENFDSLAMGNNFSGLCQTGFWGCFDEFNRLKAEVLSVVSTQIKSIQQSLAQKKKTVTLLGRDINVLESVGIFVTMNPGYEGRSDLPDNLKALFRPVVMVKPDNRIICENMLMSEGFNSSRLLAKKMTVLYKLAQEQLSQQDHYDFGLRALKSVLVMAGALKRGSPSVPEEKVIMRALRDMNMPKFVQPDVELFLKLIEDLFPDLVIESVTHKQLRGTIEQQLTEQGLQVRDKCVMKVVQLFETMETRHATMIIGQSQSGKTVIIETLQQALTAQGTPVKTFTINPKAQGLFELYGKMDKQTREWTDGLLSKLFRKANENLKSGHEDENKWIIFDGDVDAVWIENMNSVMDSNKILTLSNGDRIRLASHCKLLFEVGNLVHASPATISRSGMVYIDKCNLDSSDIFLSWCSKYEGTIIKSEEDASMLLKDYFKKLAQPALELIFKGKTPEGDQIKPLSLIIDRNEINLTRQLCVVCEALMPDQLGMLDSNHLESIFLFAVTWSLGACILPEDREIFSKSLKDISNVFFAQTTLFQNYYDVQEKDFFLWDNLLQNQSIEKNIAFRKILIPTTDTVKYKFLLKSLDSKQKPVLLVGNPGTSKTVVIKDYLNQLNKEKNTILTINFSSRTTSLEVQNSIENLCDRRTPLLYGPKGNKKLLLFIDEMHMPNKDKYGTQQPIALLKLLLEKNMMYERGGQLEERKFKDLNLITALLPPKLGYNSINSRFLSLINCIGVTFPSENNLLKIYNSILSSHLEPFDQKVRQLSDKITIATLELYKSIVKKLPRTPTKFHYMFNLRDLSKVFQGLTRLNLQFLNSQQSLLRLWKFECLRVFRDRLSDTKDINFFKKQLLPEIASNVFSEELVQEMCFKEDKEGEESILHDYLFTDFLQLDLINEEADDPKLLQEVVGISKIEEKALECLEIYNNENHGKELNLVLFNEALQHLNQLLRVLSFPQGHALLVGYGGSGKKSIAQLASFIADMQLFTISLKRNYKEIHFREDLEDMYLNYLTGEKPVLFLFTDTQLVDDSFLELINTILNSGIIPGMFDEAKKNELRNAFRDRCKKDTGEEGPEEVWEYFKEYAQENIHVVLAMSPAGDSLRRHCRNFPALIAQTTIDWFFQWPEEALSQVARHQLADFVLPQEIKEKVEQFIVKQHLRAPVISEEFLKQTGRKVYQTPKDFLDFLNGFQSLSNEKQKQSTKLIARYKKGLTKLTESAQKIEIMKNKISLQHVEVSAQQKEVKELLQMIAEKTEIVSKKQETAEIQKNALAQENREIKKSKEEADAILAEKLPALKAARQKVSEIKKTELDYIKSLGTPHKLIQTTVMCLQILRVNANANENDGWIGAKSMLSDLNLVHGLIEFSKDEKKIAKVTSKQIKLINEKLKYIESELKTKKKDMDVISPACTKLLFWVNAVKLLYDTNQIIKPLKNKVSKLTKEKLLKETQLQEATEALKALNSELQSLNEKQALKSKDLEILTKKLQINEKILNKAVKLITDLENERVRWAQDKDQTEKNQIYLTSEVLIASAFLSYLGPFDQNFRKQSIQLLLKDLKLFGFPMYEDFSIQKILSKEVEIARWNQQGLPNDSHSVQNGILTLRSQRYSFCIDPQQQAYQWLLKKEQKLQICSFGPDSDFGRVLEISINFGKPLLIENISTWLDPLLEPILQRNFIERAGVLYVKLGKEEVIFKDDLFKLYLVSKLSNPKLSPEIMSKTAVINYSVTFEGLREQLLSEVVGYEQKEKEELRQKMIEETNENKQTLNQLELDLLETLVNSKGSLLKNENLVTTLENTKQNSSMIAISLAENTAARAILDEARQIYIDVAIRGAVLFFCMQKLSVVSKMYEYSLGSYLEVFQRALNEANPDQIQSQRITNIIDKLTFITYNYVLLGLFERHKIMFSLQMTLGILEQKEDLDQKKLSFFLRGNVLLKEELGESPYSWVLETAWKDLNALSKVNPNWNLLEQIRNNNKLWKNWTESLTPESIKLPKPLENASSLDMLMFLRVFRPDRVVKGVKNFILEQFGENEHFVQSPTLNFKKILRQSSNTSPIVFILSPGADPIQDVQNLAETEGFVGSKFKYLSLGQNMEAEAEDLIANSSSRGYWAMLQNCDLLPGWLPDLERILNDLRKNKKISPDFRLWLTTKPLESFPLGILQKSLKVVTEPPEGLRFNMKAIASKLTDKSLEGSKHYAFRPLTYVIIFFHSILLDRRKFGKIGFNVQYDFNESDFRISFELLRLYLNKSIQNKEDSLPWGSLKYLIGEAMYGGRVTDNFDRRVLTTYLDEYMGDFLFDNNTKFSFSKSEDFNYILPEFKNVENLSQKINELPPFDAPQVFGLNPNSEITFFTNQAKYLWSNMLAMQQVGEDASQKDEQINQIKIIANDILNILPEIYIIEKIKEHLGENISPIQIVLLQELERFNILIEEINSSLQNLLRALRGEIGLNSKLEDISIQLFNGFLPKSWKNLCPQTNKKLASWISHFEQRKQQYSDWITNKKLKAYWLAGLHIPESFLTALVQQTCRKKKWALDKSKLYTQMTKYQSPDQIDKELETGCYIYGLFIEGVAWDVQNQKICPQKPKSLIQELPLMQVIPIESQKLKLKDTIKVPVYMTQSRRNARGEGLIFISDLFTKIHDSHWVLQGISIVLNKDE